tara:strand:- start:132 stop:2000 length:1869 start_codon:yes stop_codon:yes gene_type:complete
MVEKIVEEVAEEVFDINTATIEDALDQYIKVLNKEKKTAKLLKQNLAPIEKIRGFLKQNNLLDTPISAFQDKNFVDKFWLQVQDIADLDLEKGGRSFFVGAKGELVESKSRMLHSKLGTAMSKISGWNRASWDGILKVQPVDLDSGFFSKSTRVGFDFGNEGMNRIVRAIKNIKNPQAKNLAIIKLFTGIRTTDLKELTLAQIDLDRRILEYVGGKKGLATVGKPQTVSELVAAALRDQLSLSGVNDPDGLIFKNADALEKQAMKEIRESIALVSGNDGKIFKVKKWNSALGKIDTEAIEFNFKMLRNAIAKTAIGEGATYNEVATVLGHFKPSDVTAGYFATTSVRPVPDQAAYKLMTQVQSNYLQFAGFNSPAEYGQSVGIVNSRRLPKVHIYESKQKAFQLHLEGVPSSKTKKGLTLEPTPSGEATTQDVTQRLTDVERENIRIKEEQAKMAGEFNEKQRLKKVKANAAKILKNLGIDIKTLKSIAPWLITAGVGGGTWLAPKLAEAAIDVTLTAGKTGAGTVKDEIQRLMGSGLSEQEAINEYKLQQQQSPVYEAERDLRFGKNIESYETNFIEKQKAEKEKTEYEKQHQEDVEKIWTKGLFHDIKQRYTEPEEQGFM